MIRELVDSDLFSVKTIYNAAFPNEHTVEDLEESWLNRSKENSYGIFYEDSLAGFVVCSFHRKSGSNLYIDYIAVDLVSRGQGLGTKLLHHMIDKCSRQRRGLHLFPNSFELAAWYKTFGFYETPDTNPVPGKPPYYLNWSPYEKRARKDNN